VSPPLQPETSAVDLTDQPTTLIYVSKLPGNGLVAGYGYIRAFAFDLPTALRRLAEAIEKGE
jgi:hypothetical protein